MRFDGRRVARTSSTHRTERQENSGQETPWTEKSEESASGGSRQRMIAHTKRHAPARLLVELREYEREEKCRTEQNRIQEK